MEALRQTGRTTRLVEKACREALIGRAVYILALDVRQVKYIQHQVEGTWARMHGAEGRRHGIKVESMMDWEGHRQWDWNDMLPMHRDYHPNCLFLVDHAAVEFRLDQVQADIKYLAKLAGTLFPHTV